MGKYVRILCGMMAVLVAATALGLWQLAEAPQYVAAAGGDLFMPGNKGDYDNLLQGIDSGAVALEQVKIGASRVVKMARALTQALILMATPHRLC